MVQPQHSAPAFSIAPAEFSFALALICLTLVACGPIKDIGSYTESGFESVGATVVSVSNSAGSTDASSGSDGSTTTASTATSGTSTGPEESTTTSETSAASATTTMSATTTTSDETTGTTGGPTMPMGGDEERKVVFITDAFFTGDFGGLEGADAICQSAASEATLSGTYRAWLSDETGSPSTRFVQSTVPYVRLDGAVVANDWQDLLDGELATAIDLTQKGNAPGGNVFTNTQPDGTPWNGLHCMNWTDLGSPTPGNGFPPNTDASWTQGGAGSNCFDLLHLYCFEQ